MSPPTNIPTPRWSTHGRGCSRAGCRRCRGRDAIAKLKERAFRDKIKADEEFGEYINEHGGWEGIVGTIFNVPKNKEYEGKTILEISKLRGDADPAETCFDLVVEEGAFVPGVHHTMSEDDVKFVMQVPWVSIASDGSALNLKVPGKPHPRSFGTNVRVLGKYVRTTKCLRSKTPCGK